MSNAIINIESIDFQWVSSDPFLFCAFHRDSFPQGNPELGPNASLAGRNIGQDFVLKDGWRMYHGDKIPGFPSHPHRGFETVTIVSKGVVDHADSLGMAGRYGNGDVQWLTTGKGVQHSEMFPMLNQKGGNDLLLFQIWLNLPAANKMVEPHFTMFWQENMPVVESVDEDGKKVKVEIIAGDLKGMPALKPPPDSWAADPENAVAIWLIELEAGAAWELPAAPVGLNRRLYFYEGNSLECDGKIIPVSHAVKLKSEELVTLKNPGSRAKLLMLQGKPINEPVAQHGPFVMNTRTELQQAFLDYQNTHFGGWPWPRNDQVHGSERGRFALYLDDKIEEP